MIHTSQKTRYVRTNFDQLCLKIADSFCCEWCLKGPVRKCVKINFARSTTTANQTNAARLEMHPRCHLLWQVELLWSWVYLFLFLLSPQTVLWKEWPDVPHTQEGRYQFLAITNLSLNSWYEFQVTPVLRNQQEGIVTGHTSPIGGPYRTLCSGELHTDSTYCEDFCSYIKQEFPMVFRN